MINGVASHAFARRWLNACVRFGEVMSQRWDTGRVAGWGIIVGLIFTAVEVAMPHQGEMLSGGLMPIIGYAFAGAGGGAALFALVSGMRNLILRAY